MPEDRPPDPHINGERTQDFLDSLREIDEITDEDLKEIYRPLFGENGSLRELFEKYGDYINFDFRGRPGLDRLTFSVVIPGEIPLIDTLHAEQMFGGKIIYDPLRAGYQVNVYRWRDRGPVALSIYDAQEDFHIRYYLQPDGEVKLVAIKGNRKGTGVANAPAQLYASRFANSLINYEPPDENQSDMVNPDLFNENGDE